MVKDNRHRTRALVTPDGHEISISTNPAVFAFIGTIQEEVHRFTIQYHRLLRSKRMQASQLEKIEGVGPKRREALLKKFRSVSGIRNAELSQLRELAGEEWQRWLTPVLRSLGIAVVAGCAADVCRDLGQDSVASGVELAGKAEIMLVCLPLITELLSVVRSLFTGDV